MLTTMQSTMHEKKTSLDALDPGIAVFKHLVPL